MSVNRCRSIRFIEKGNARGFSILELLVVVGIMLILSAIAVPQIMATVRIYQLTSAASQVADAAKFARFEAIRRNINVNCLASPLGASWEIGTDSNGNGVIDVAERHYEFAANVTFLSSAGVPTASSLPAALSVGAVTVLSGNAATQTIAFDPRGAVNFAASSGGAATIYVFFVGSSDPAVQEYRAVVVMPSGTTQIWMGGAATAWNQVS